MYEARNSIYCYEGTNTLVNKLNIKTNQIEINYEIEEQLFIFKLEYEEGELWL